MAGFDVRRRFSLSSTGGYGYAAPLRFRPQGTPVAANTPQQAAPQQRVSPAQPLQAPRQTPSAPQAEQPVKFDLGFIDQDTPAMAPGRDFTQRTGMVSPTGDPRSAATPEVVNAPYGNSLVPNRRGPARLAPTAENDSKAVNSPVLQVTREQIEQMSKLPQMAGFLKQLIEMEKNGSAKLVTPPQAPPAGVGSAPPYDGGGVGEDPGARGRVTPIVEGPPEDKYPYQGQPPVGSPDYDPGAYQQPVDVTPEQTGSRPPPAGWAPLPTLDPSVPLDSNPFNMPIGGATDQNPMHFDIGKLDPVQLPYPDVEYAPASNPVEPSSYVPPMELTNLEDSSYVPSGEYPMSQYGDVSLDPGAPTPELLPEDYYAVKNYDENRISA